MQTVLRTAVDVRDDEIGALLWSFAYFFCLLGSYYILRPLRDEMGVAAGVENMQWLFTGTFFAMLAAVPLFGWVFARFPRRRFVPLIYHFFTANILIFFLLLTLVEDRTHIARAFFIWVSLFNLFVVSVFWSFMADLFDSGQGRRLFGFIAAGGSAGAVLGPGVTALLAVPLGAVNLLLVSALLLELAVLCIRRLLRTTPQDSERRRVAVPDAPMGGGILAGVALIVRSPYLLGICLYILLYTTTSTILYFQQAHIIAGASDDPSVRTRLFALIDLAVGIFTILLQIFVTGRFLRWLGVGPGLAVAPLVTLLGFLALASAPALAVLMVFQSTRRAINFAISRPAREVLFTVVGREAKYKAKNMIDTVVFRGGDMASGWAYAGLSAAGLELVAIALLAVPVSAVWLAAGLLLGRRQESMAAPELRPVPGS